MLIHLEKISAVFVENGKMSGNNGFAKSDIASVRYGKMRFQVQQFGVLTNGQITAERIQKTQRMQLSLLWSMPAPGQAGAAKVAGNRDTIIITARSAAKIFLVIDTFSF